MTERNSTPNSTRRPDGRRVPRAVTAVVATLAVAVVGVGVGVGAGAVLSDEPVELGFLPGRGDGGEAEDDAGTDGGATTAPPTSAPTTAAPTTAPTTAAPTTVPETTTTTEPDDGTLTSGDDGPEVQALQQRLSDLGYWLGTPDGSYGSITAQAVLAFQKAEGLSRDGIAGPVTQERLATAQRMAPRDPSGDRIEVDLERQIMLIVRGGQLAWVLNTSTGTTATPTPPGTFTISREIDGMRHAPLGQLYRPKYFNGGIALHGSNSIPGGPASHGCTRLSNAAMDMLWADGFAPIGTTVVVY